MKIKTFVSRFSAAIFLVIASVVFSLVLTLVTQNPVHVSASAVSVTVWVSPNEGESVPYHVPVNLNWSSSGAGSCELTGDQTGVFSGWLGGSLGKTSGTLTGTGDGGQDSGTVTITCFSGSNLNGTSASGSASITWNSATYSLAVTPSGAGSGSIIGVSTPASAISCTWNGSSQGGTCNDSYSADTSVTLTETPTSNSVFAGWGGSCYPFGTATTCTVTMNQAQTVSAVFNVPTIYTLTVVPSGATGSGSITGVSNPSQGNISCMWSQSSQTGACSNSYTSGTSVTLTITPSPGSVFSGWSGGGCSGTGSCVVTMNQTQTVTAAFTLAPPTSLPPSQLSTISVGAINNTQNPPTSPGLIWVYWPSQGSGYTYTVSANPSYPGSVETTTGTGVNMGCAGGCYNGGGPFPGNGPYTFTVSAISPNNVITGVGTSNQELVSGLTAAQSPRPLSGWAWSDTIGWISFSSSDFGTGSNGVGTSPIAYGVSMDPTTGNLSGYAWSSNVGWISFNTVAYTCPFQSDPQNQNCQPNVNTSTGQVTGWARVVSAVGNESQGWDGWISLSGTNDTTAASPSGSQGVTYNGAGATTINGVTSVPLVGYAWGGGNANAGVIGWIQFNPPFGGVYVGAAPSNTTATGAIEVKSVGSSLTTADAPAGIASGIDSNSSSFVSDNPAYFNGISATNHSVSVTASGISGDTIYMATCTYSPVSNETVSECSTSGTLGTSASQISPSQISCVGNVCTVTVATVPVTANTVTKVAFEFVPPAPLGAIEIKSVGPSLTISDAPSGIAPTVDSVAASPSTANPAYFNSLASGNHSVTISVPTGYNISWASCQYSPVSNENVSECSTAGSFTAVPAGNISCTSAACTITDTTQTVSGTVTKIALEFVPAVLPYSLTVSPAGTGTGTVTGPDGISCSYDPSQIPAQSGVCSASISPSTVTLNATPGSGDTIEWGGPCSGNGSCQFTLAGNTSVIAQFDIPTVSGVGCTQNCGGNGGGSTTGTINVSWSVSSTPTPPAFGLTTINAFARSASQQLPVVVSGSSGNSSGSANFPNWPIGNGNGNEVGVSHLGDYSVTASVNGGSFQPAVCKGSWCYVAGLTVNPSSTTSVVFNYIYNSPIITGKISCQLITSQYVPVGSSAQWSIVDTDSLATGYTLASLLGSNLGNISGGLITVPYSTIGKRQVQISDNDGNSSAPCQQVTVFAAPTFSEQ